MQHWQDPDMDLTCCRPPVPDPGTPCCHKAGCRHCLGTECYGAPSHPHDRAASLRAGRSFLPPHSFPTPPGTEVPKATKTTAVTESLRPMVQPKWEARSPMTAVSMPMMRMETMKQAQPLQYSVGGTQANSTFQKTVRKCIT